jgi:hypothetical protein
MRRRIHACHVSYVEEETATHLPRWGDAFTESSIVFWTRAWLNENTPPPCQKRPTIGAKETKCQERTTTGAKETWLNEKTPPPQREGIGVFVRSSERIQPTAHISSLLSYLYMYRYRCTCIDIGLSGAPRGYSQPPTYRLCCHNCTCLDIGAYLWISVHIGIYNMSSFLSYPRAPAFSAEEYARVRGKVDFKGM